MGGLEICSLTRRYRIKDRPLEALSNVHLRIEEGSFVTVVGKSGCGKTTLLRLICGLETADEGSVRFLGPGSTGRTVSIVFQEPRLMPWLTVRQNMAFALVKGKNRSRADGLVDKCLDRLGLTPFKDAYPHQISGGMAQRTALGRTLCLNPEIILMDEPFGALDAFTRRSLQQELVEIFVEQKKTIVFVTHDVDEAVLLGQRVLVMDQGTIVRDVAVDLPYPRDTLDRAFFGVREDILRTILGS
ncbi:MAG: ABC transporter ATP-binding protein [Pseudomonadota bacterium]